MTAITVARGDGIGPEIMDATLAILDAAKADLRIEEITIGKTMFDKGIATGIEDSSWDSLKRTRVFLKAPIYTPQGGGFKSLNVTVRKTLGLYANVRPCASFAPYIPCHFPRMDMVIVRENEEDLYSGVEYRPTRDVVTAFKMITRRGSERIIRYAFEYARQNGRHKVTCMSKDNIMKMADGLFHKTFDEIGADYPDIEKDHFIIDIGAARIASRPEIFDVIVTENLYGDIISDIAADVAGSVGIGISANIGEDFAMFEAMHGTAPDIAGKGIANPSGLLLGAVMMLVHIGKNDVAERVHNAWLRTIEDGIHTGDLYSQNLSVRRVGTADFARAIIDRLGSGPIKLKAASYGQSSGGGGMTIPPVKPLAVTTKTRAGVDVYVEWPEADAGKLAGIVQQAGDSIAPLKGIVNRGVKVWPGDMPAGSVSDHWRLRFIRDNLGADDVIALQSALLKAGLDIVSVEHLPVYDGVNGFTAGQGE